MKATALGLLFAITAFLFAPTSQAVSLHKKKKTAKAKKRRLPRMPAVSAARKAELLNRITREMQTSENAVENPSALVPFFEQLYRMSDGNAHASVSILHYGDSHTAADIWTGEMRSLFQSKFGNGGAGFVHAGHPWKGYRRDDVHSAASRHWNSEGLTGHPGDGNYGLSGVSIETDRAREWVSLSAEGSRLEVWYLQQPGGNTLELTDNGDPLDSIHTTGEQGPGYYVREVSPGPHNYVLTTTERAPVRLFGWVTGNPTGVTYDMLGINGAQASMILDWNPQLLADQIGRRKPALIVLAYGTNEASNPRMTDEVFREVLTLAIRRMREAAPQASILLVGPPDRALRKRGRWEPYEAVSRMIAAEHTVAESTGCAFYDLRGKMGGIGVMHDWALAGLAQSDHVHLTGTGYRLSAQSLFGDIMAQYSIFLRAREADPVKEDAPK